MVKEFLCVLCDFILLGDVEVMQFKIIQRVIAPFQGSYVFLF